MSPISPRDRKDSVDGNLSVSSSSEHNNVVSSLPFRSRAGTGSSVDKTTPLRARADTAPSILGTLQTSPDEELKRATALAMAIRKNPNMSIEEIHKLVEQQTPAASSAATSKRKLAFRFDGSRLKAIGSSIMTGGSINKDPSVASTEDDGAGDKKNKQDASRAKTTVASKEPMAIYSSASGDDADISSSGNRKLRSNANKLGKTPPQSPLNLTLSYGQNKSAEKQPPASGTIVQTKSGVSFRRDSTPIRLTAIVWKRRGGMGKYSTTGGWERRRIELQGTRILYYAKDETDCGDEADESQTMTPPVTQADASMQTLSQATTGTDTAGEELGEGLVVTKQSNWFESAFAAPPLDPSAPRGSLDLAKEKATVNAAPGQGGPSPFCISIKVRGESKWKFCFDHHRTLMEWLAALTDVVVQNSVDMYNAQLIELADPAHSVTAADAAANTLNFLANQVIANNILSSPISTAPMQVKSPPGATAGTRLWQTQPYCISSQTPPEEEDEDDDDVQGSDTDVESIDILVTPPASATDEQHKEAQIAAVQDSSKAQVLPEHNFFRLFILVNVAIALARSSALTLSSFWYLIVFVNAALYFGLIREQPNWESLLLHVRASPDEQSDDACVPKTNATKKKNTNQAGGGGCEVVAQSPTSASKSKSVPAGYKPVAGTTTMKIKNPTDLPVNDKNEVFGGWRCPPGETLQVRSHGYMVTKKKIDSPGELFECVQVDIFEAPNRYPDVASLVQLPKVSFDDPDTPKTWRTPDIFVVTIALPTDPPKLTRSGDDGGGYTLVMYFAMKKETRDVLRRVTADGYEPSQEDQTGEDIQKSKVNAIRLLEEWVRRAPTDPKWFSRFKCVPNAHNLKEIGMPSWIAKYNGKPFLIKRPGVTGFIHQHPEMSCLEFDISLHPFPYLARQAICFMKEAFFKKVLVSFGFVVEGRSDDELPECVIGSMQLCYPDPAHAIQAKDFFAGTAPKSFE